MEPRPHAPVDGRVCSRLCDGLMAQTCPGDTAVQGVKADPVPLPAPLLPTDLLLAASIPGGGGRAHLVSPAAQPDLQH